MDDFNDSTRQDGDRYAQDTDAQLRYDTASEGDGQLTDASEGAPLGSEDWASRLPDFDTPEGDFEPFSGSDIDSVTYQESAQYEPSEEDVDASSDLATKQSGNSESIAQAAGAAGSMVSAAGKHLADGFTAVRDVRKMAKRHASAKAQMRALKAVLEEDRSVLDHRMQIERDYGTIVAEQNSEIDAAQAALDDAAQRIAQLESDRTDFNTRLDALKASNEERISPYRSLMETTKGRADDAQVALSDAKRALKAAENQQSSATRRRDQRISSANRAVDNASERLRRSQADFDKQSQDPENRDAVAKLRNQIVSDQAHLDSAREEVERATAESKREVENAQALVWDQQQRFTAASTEAESAKQEASRARAEYDAIFKECQAAEGSLEDQIKELTRLIDATEQERETASERIDGAKVILAEAQDIHDTPEVTQNLANKVREEQAELARQHEEVRDIAQSEKHLRKSTRTKRITFFAIIAALLVLIVLVVWLVFFKPPAKTPEPASKPTQTQTTQTQTTDDTKTDDTKTDETSDSQTDAATQSTDASDNTGQDAGDTASTTSVTSTNTTGTTTNPGKTGVTGTTINFDKTDMTGTTIDIDKTGTTSTTGTESITTGTVITGTGM